MKRNIVLKVLTAWCFLAVGPAQAVIIGWNFTDLNATFDTGTPSNFTVGDITIGNTFGTVATPVNGSSVSTGYTGATGGGNIGNAVNVGTLSTSTSGYYSVTFTPSSNYSLNITDFNFGMRSTSTGPQAYALYSSADNFASSLFTGTISNNSTWTYKTNPSFNLTGTTNSAITLRLYTGGGSGNPSSNTINNRLDDITINLVANTVSLPAAPSISQSQSGLSLTLSNAANVAAAKITGTNINGDSAFTAPAQFSPNTVIASGSNVTGTAGFNSTGKLNGTYTASLAVSLAANQDYVGGTNGTPLPSQTFNLTSTVTTNSASTGNASLNAGTSFNGFGLTNNTGKNTQATLLSGTAGGAGANLNFTFQPSSTAANASAAVSDILNLTTGTDPFVLQLNFDPAGASLGGNASNAFLAWNNGTLFINAVLGNSGNTSYANSKFFGTYAAFLASLTGFTGDLNSIMGAYGVDTATSTVWAVLNHNSEFTVVPEPTTHAMLFAGVLMLLWVVRRRSVLV